MVSPLSIHRGWLLARGQRQTCQNVHMLDFKPRSGSLPPFAKEAKFLTASSWHLSTAVAQGPSCVIERQGTRCFTVAVFVTGQPPGGRLPRHNMIAGHW